MLCGCCPWKLTELSLDDLVPIQYLPSPTKSAQEMINEGKSNLIINLGTSCTFHLARRPSLKSIYLGTTNISE